MCVCACGWLGTWDWCVGDDDDGMIESYGLLVASGGLKPCWNERCRMSEVTSNLPCGVRRLVVSADSLQPSPLTER